MKVRTGIIIAAAVVVGVGGIGYGLYYISRSQQTPVEVAPVSNISLDDTWVTYDDSMSGTVTSKVSQNVSLDSEHEVDEVYVREGQHVKEGDPLFSYDMTLEEIELEAQEIELQSLQLQLSKYQKDLTKYQNTPATATLEEVDYDDLSESAEEAPAAEEAYEEPAQPEAAEAPQPVEEAAPEEPAVSVEEPAAEPVAEPAQDSAVNEPEENDNSSTVSDASSGEDAYEEDVVNEEAETEQSESTNDEDAVYRNAVMQFESLMMSVEMFLDANGNLDYNSSVVSALYNALDFFQNNLANNVQQETFNENGETYVQTSYELKKEVVHALSDAELAELKDYVSRMFSYIATYEAQPAALSAQPEVPAETLAEETEEETELLTEEESEEEESESEETEMQIAMFSFVTVQDELTSDEGTEEEPPKDSSLSREYEAESEVSIPASDRTDEGYTFEFWQSSLSYVTIEDPFSETARFKVPADDLTLTAVYTKTDSEEDIAGSSVTTFIDWVDYIHDVPSTQAPDETNLLKAMEYYLEYLSTENPLPEGTTINDLTIEELLGSYYDLELDEAVKDYLNNLESEDLEALLIKLGIDTEDLDEEDYTQEVVNKLQSMYKNICMEYCIYQLSNQYDEIAALQKNQSRTDEESEELDRLLDEFKQNLDKVYSEYLKLDEDSINSVLKNLLQEFYDKFYPETEPDSDEEVLEDLEDLLDELLDDYWGDYDWDEGEEEEYTAEELEEMIAELERQIKETELSIKECELNLEQAQRVVDERIVTSELDGTVVSIGDTGEDSDDEYFVKVTDMVGLYAKGVISELLLDTVNLGDVVSGISDDGQSFTAVIKDIADYPDADGADYTYGTGNTNTSYYTFSALIDDPDGIEEGSAELTLSTALADDSHSIWLDTYMVRTDAAGNNYVYVEGDNGELETRYVTTGAVDSDWAIEITAGLSRSDNIAFPYGDNVFEGAPTKEVSNLDSMYE